MSDHEKSIDAHCVLDWNDMIRELIFRLTSLFQEISRKSKQYRLASQELEPVRAREACGCEHLDGVPPVDVRNPRDGELSLPVGLPAAPARAAGASSVSVLERDPQWTKTH